jgi:hypothetical protein
MVRDILVEVGRPVIMAHKDERRRIEAQGALAGITRRLVWHLICLVIYRERVVFKS